MLSHTSVLAQIAHAQLGSFVSVNTYHYVSCYLWRDRPIYNAFGERVAELKGNTIYLNQSSDSPVKDLFHEIGHAVGRKFNVIGHAENDYRGFWDKKAARHIGTMKRCCHWSAYLNSFALMHDGFDQNGNSELWAELFMLWFLYPQMPECGLITKEMQRLEGSREIQKIKSFAQSGLVKKVYTMN